MNRLSHIPLIVGLLVSAHPALAQEEGRVFKQQDGRYAERITRSVRVKPGGTLFLVSSQGAVKVETWDQNEVQVVVEKLSDTLVETDARATFKDFQVFVHPEGNDIRVRAESRSGLNRPSLNVNIRLIVPDKYHVEVQRAGEGIGVQKVSGNLELQTSGGGIQVGESGGDLSATTMGGDIQVGKATGRVTVTTDGGGITIGPVGGKVTALTAGGGISIERSQSAVDARTAGGGIQVGGSGGPIRVSTSGGNIRIRDARGYIEAKTEGGSIEAELVVSDRRIDTHCTLETSGGDITLTLPENLAATVQADLRIKRKVGREYRIYSDFPLVVKTDDPKRITGSGEINGGGYPIRLSTVNGDIYIKKMK
ncbi:MAG: hypothetical protein EXS64_02340 [Candidatus Latescibacteria bacterium]|nr:hypothetical protein [Candidatus Latescibacterota bacterium]